MERKKTKHQKTAGRREETQETSRVDAIIQLLQEVNDHLSALTEAYERTTKAFEEAMGRVTHLEERFSRLNAVLTRLERLESEVHDITRGYLERLEAIERRQAAIEEADRQKAA